MIYTQEKVKEYQQKFPHQKHGFRNWNNTALYEWEFRLLLNASAIGYNGVKKNYPILKIRQRNDSYKYRDLGGDKRKIYQAINELKGNGSIDYSSRYFDEWEKFRNNPKKYSIQDIEKIKDDDETVNVSEVMF